MVYWCHGLRICLWTVTWKFKFLHRPSFNQSQSWGFQATSFLPRWLSFIPQTLSAAQDEPFSVHPLWCRATSPSSWHQLSTALWPLPWRWAPLSCRPRSPSVLLLSCWRRPTKPTSALKYPIWATQLDLAPSVLSSATGPSTLPNPRSPSLLVQSITSSRLICHFLAWYRPSLRWAFWDWDRFEPKPSMFHCASTLCASQFPGPSYSQPLIPEVCSDLSWFAVFTGTFYSV